MNPVPALAMHSRELDSMWTVRKKPFASLVARYCASTDIWPDTYSATASGPCWSTMSRSRLPASATASSTGAGIGSSLRDGRTSADLSRPSEAAIISAWVAPLVHSRPKLAGCSLSPETLAMTGTPASAVVVTSMPQPTPQYEHAVRVVVINPPVRAPSPRTRPCVGAPSAYEGTPPMSPPRRRHRRRETPRTRSLPTSPGPHRRPATRR